MDRREAGERDYLRSVPWDRNNGEKMTVDRGRRRPRVLSRGQCGADAPRKLRVECRGGSVAGVLSMAVGGSFSMFRRSFAGSSGVQGLARRLDPRDGPSLLYTRRHEISTASKHPSILGAQGPCRTLHALQFSSLDMHRQPLVAFATTKSSLRCGFTCRPPTPVSAAGLDPP